MVPDNALEQFSITEAQKTRKKPDMAKDELLENGGRVSTGTTLERLKRCGIGPVKEPANFGVIQKGRGCSRTRALKIALRIYLKQPHTEKVKEESLLQNLFCHKRAMVRDGRFLWGW